MIRRLFVIVTVIFLLPTEIAAQEVEGRWVALYATGPVARIGDRHDDLHFIDENTGWVVNGRGEVHQTIDGGLTWEMVHQQLGVHFRSVSFANANRGWVGSLTAGNVLFETYDGGATGCH